MDHYIEPTSDGVRALLARGIEGPVVMLNLLRFRDIADYSRSPELAPAEPISGADAYRRYFKLAGPFLAARGGELLFDGTGGSMLIGPTDKYWDRVLLVRHRSVDDFLSFAKDEGYLKVVGHRTAALLDSRLLPLQTAS